MDIGSTTSIYRYPHIVLSCEHEQEEQSYSAIYGRLLIDRAVKKGLLTEIDSKAVPKGDFTSIEGEEYYAYPKNHISVVDLSKEELTIQGRLCTSRGMDGKHDMYGIIMSLIIIIDYYHHN